MRCTLMPEAAGTADIEAVDTAAVDTEAVGTDMGGALCRSRYQPRSRV